MMSLDHDTSYFPLSLSQQNIWDLERAYPGTSINNISTTVHIQGHLDIPILQESIHLVLENDSSLCMRLTVVDDKVMQYQVPYVREDFPVYDFSNTSKSGIENWEKSVTRELMPLENKPLYRFVIFREAERNGGFLVKLHHIIADGWSQIAICNKIAQTYLDLLAGKKPSLERTPDYQLHVQEEQDYLASKAFLKDERYWKRILEQAGEPSVLKHVSSAAVSPVGRRLSFELPQILNHAIYTFCEKNRVAPFAVFYMALSIYFKRIGGSDRFTIGVPIFNRTSYEFKQSTGMFVTTLPFFNEICDEWTLNRFNEELMERWYELLRHQRYPFSKISELSGREGRLFHIALSYQDSKILQSHDASVSLAGRWHYCGYQAEQLTIHLTNLLNHQRYAVDYDYLAQFFAEDEIVALHNNICHILSEALTDPDRPIHSLNVLSLTEKEKLIYTFNDTDRYIPETSVYDMLSRCCRKYQNRAALICNGERLTYGALMYLSARYAMAIDESGVEDDDLVAILLPREFDLFAAMIGTLQAGCGYLILSRELPEERIKHILNQSNAAVLITDEAGAEKAKSWAGTVICSEDIDSYGGFYVPRKRAKQSEIPVAERLAYVVYTSGSTGEPKGVEITQRNVLNLAQEMEPVYGQGAVLSVCNVGFDAFMLESIAALMNGKTIVLPADEELESPERLAALITGYAVGFISTTPSRLSAFLKSKSFRNVTWKLESIVCGGEGFPAELLKKLKKLTNARIYNQYGPSETTVGVSLKELSYADRITAGAPMGNCRLYILDHWMNPLPVGGCGNLYVGGKCVGRGYRNMPDQTAKSFLPSPFVTDERIYATGDVACWTSDGEIVLLGRADSQIKLRGLRIELQEVVSCIESYPGVQCAAARVCQLHGEQVLGAYYCSDDRVSEGDLLSHAATYLPRYMIPAFLIRLNEIPRTANGKVDESCLPMPLEPAALTRGELSRTGAIITDIFCQILQNDSLHGNSDYFLYGGNSLNAMECIMQIESKLGRRIRIADLYACRTPSRLAAYLDGDKCGVTAPVAVEPVYTKAPRRSEYELTAIQQGIYVQSLLDSTGFSYNMPGAFLLEHAPDKVRLQTAVNALIDSDPIFRTSFVQKKDGVFACVAQNAEVLVEDLIAEDFHDACKQFLRSFDLSKAPLLRAALWQSADDSWYLFLDSHHIIGDGMSTPLILKRLDEAYRTGYSHVKWDYYDCMHTAQSRKDLLGTGSDIHYWTDHLRDLPDPLQLPCDYPRSKQFDFKGREIEILLSEKLTEACDLFCKEQGHSTFTLFLAAYGILLSAISGREDFVIGSPVAGRLSAQSNEVCGPFINTLPLRLMPNGKLQVRQWLASVQSEVAGMLDHQQVALEEIIQALDLTRGAQNALYQIMMTQSPVDEEAFSLDGGKMTYHPIATGTVKMDLIMELTRKHHCHALRLSYATGLFREDTIRFYGRCLEKIITELIGDQNCLLSQLRLMSETDYQTYVEVPNYKVLPFVNLPLHKLLYNKVVSKGDNTAVIFHDQQISYRKLEKRACAIAHFLSQQGLKPGQAVALCLSRTPDIIAAMYGVLKAGGAFVFMLPKFPMSRLRYMLETSCAGLILYDAASQSMLPDEFWSETLPCSAHLLPDGETDTFTDRPVTGESIAEIHFTSGSTGQPKGVMFRHRAVSNLYAQVQTLLAPYPGNVLCSTNSVFDCFLVETLVSLALGRVVILADEEEMMLPWKLAHLISTYETAVFEMTPARLQMCLNNDAFCKAASHIRVLLVGGEALTKNLQLKFHAHSDGQLINMYGPSESTIYTTCSPLGPEDIITIGKPLQNIRAYVLDEQMRPVLPTACGELYIAGECLAAGYVSRPDLTEAAFLNDIYFPDEKMYRTGDMVRLRIDGNYEFLGRKDAQVKLNGQRVELNEITGAILGSGYVRQAATVAVRMEDGSMELCSFYESDEHIADEEDIFRYMNKILPAYMIPSRLIRIDSMPMTASNKIDVRQLQQIARKDTVNIHSDDTASITPIDPVSADTPKQKSATVDVDYVFSVWNQILSVPATDPNRSFFSQGGTSMAALSVLSAYYNNGHEMSLSDFYAYPTAAQQVALMNGKHSDTLQDTSKLQETAPALLGTSDSIKVEKVAKQNGAVLITGATGFFGAHLLKELAAGESDRQIICLLRDGDPARLMDCLSWYFGHGFAQRLIERVQVINGDISQPLLGLSTTEYQHLADITAEIYHCAADVRHFVTDEEAYLKTNVDGTSHMLDLACSAEATFHHMSTCSVSGDRVQNGSGPIAFTEDDYDIGQNWEENIYVKSKFLAEGYVRQAAEAGLNVHIYRLGRLVGRMSDGVFQKNPDTNVFYLLMRAFCELGVFPENASCTEVDVMPIDLAAREVLVLKDDSASTFHIMHHEPPTFAQIAAASGGRLRLVDDVEFDRIFTEKQDQLDPHYRGIITDYLYRIKNSSCQIDPTNKLTVQALNRAGFTPETPSLKRILQDFLR